jgi:hypothetical protein
MSNLSEASSAPLCLSAKAKRTRPPPISALIAAAVPNPDLISFAAGLVDPATLPVDYCFHPDAHGRLPLNHVRLSFGQVATERIEEGIVRLASVVRDYLPRPRRGKLPSKKPQANIPEPRP